MSAPGPELSPRALALLVAAVAVSFGVCFAVFVVGAREERSAGADVDSVSALGHRPFVELLEALGVPVLVGRSRSVARAGPGALVVVAEPRPSEDAPARGGGGPGSVLAGRRAPILLVLPKRRPGRLDDAGRWVESETTLPASEVATVLRRFGGDADVVHVADAARAAALRDGELSPTVAPPLQLLAPHRGLRPIVASDDGVLLGQLEPPDASDEDEDDAGDAPPVYVLSDPDVLAAHGLHRGRNAELVVGWVERLRPPGGMVVLDAQAQGRGRTPSLWRELTSWPLALPVGTALLAALAAAWCGARRFGAPRPAASPSRARTRPLVEHAAELLEHGGHTAHALSRYAAVALHAAARDVHAPPGLTAEDARAWLDRAAAARGVGTTVAELEAVVATAARHPDPGTAIDAARRVHAWRRALTDGHPSRP
ncbi:MAG: hypothetical protein IT460_08690 [Planctomycetes bacterium]|nr:hypothetical protein [Planctomycetota bacterium]